MTDPLADPLTNLDPNETVEVALETLVDARDYVARNPGGIGARALLARIDEALGACLRSRPERLAAAGRCGARCKRGAKCGGCVLASGHKGPHEC